MVFFYAPKFSNFLISIHHEGISRTIHRPELAKHYETRIEEQQKKNDFATRDTLMEGLF